MIHDGFFMYNMPIFLDLNIPVKRLSADQVNVHYSLDELKWFPQCLLIQDSVQEKLDPVLVEILNTFYFK
jgi:hypothetical protein